MIYLFASILLTSYLILSFKMLERLGIPLFQAIVFNYVTCVLTGSVVNGSFPLNRASTGEGWFLWACVMGCLFISLFNLIGFTAQKIGVAVASVANKLSLVIPFAFSIYLYSETSTWLKISGVVIALVAVILTCMPPKKGLTPARHSLSPLLLIVLPAILFFGSGFLDTLVKYVEHNYLDGTNNDAFLIASFATAATLGLIILLVLFGSGKMKFDWRAVLAGIAIGIPNYFSIWSLVRVLTHYQGNSSAIIPINNMGIVLFSSLLAWLIFKEKLSRLNWAGIFLSMAAIALIAFG